MFRVGPLLVALLALALAAPTALAQEAAIPLRGRVVDAENNRPLRRTHVSLARGDRGMRPVLTDEDGRFEVQLRDSSTVLVIRKGGYASVIVEPDRRRVPARDLEIRLSRGAAMSGRVIEGSAPAIGARVVARRVEEASTNAASYEAETDDLGEYRIGDLPAGQYTVSVIAAGLGGRVQSFFDESREAVQGIVLRAQPLFSMTRPTAPRLVEVRRGEDAIDVDFETVPLEVTPPRPAGAAADFLKSNEQDPGAISGRVVTPSGQPISGASVSISGNNLIRMVVADGDGQFDAGRFKDGDYKIAIGRSGYLNADLRSGDGGATHIVHVGGATRVHNVEVVLARGGAITGTISDSAGEPFQGVLVRALRIRQEGSRLVVGSAGWPRLTDDRGQYRLFGLPPGSYLIVAGLDATERAAGRSRALGFAPVYAPGTAHAESAQPVQVELGSAVTGIDLTFAVSGSARVKGRALSAAGEPLRGRVALGVSLRSGGVAAEPRFARIEADGSFELADVPAGEYILQAFGDRLPGVPPEFGAEYITVSDQDSPLLTIKTAPGATLDGRFVAEARSTIPMNAQVIHAAPLDIDRSPPGGRGPEGLAVHDDGRFYLTGLHGPMRLTYSAPYGWYLKSVTIGGVDVTDQPFDFGFGDQIFPDAEIVLSTSGARITGSIEDATGKPVAASVVAFPVSRLNWFTGSRYLKRASSSGDGSFELSALPPGDYFVAVMNAVSSGDWESPEALEPLVQRATRVTLSERQMQTVTLRIGRR